MDNWITARHAIEEFQNAGIPVADACEIMRKALIASRLLCQAVYFEDGTGSEHKTSVTRGEIPSIFWQWVPKSGPDVRWRRCKNMAYAMATADWREGRFRVEANLLFIHRRRIALSRLGRIRLGQLTGPEGLVVDEPEPLGAENNRRSFNVTALLLDRYGVADLIATAANSAHATANPKMRKMFRGRPGRPPVFNKQAIISDVVEALRSESWAPNGSGDIARVVSEIERLGDIAERAKAWGGMPSDTTNKKLAREIVNGWAQMVGNI